MLYDAAKTAYLVTQEYKCDLSKLKQGSETGLMEIMEKVLDALTYAADQAVIHRDVKPANILIDEDEKGNVRNVLLADWGEARIIALFVDKRI